MNKSRILLESLGKTPLDAQNIEIVERKGCGHPDYIADAVAENLSRELCRYYRENVGVILHHNVDKGLVVGGRSSPIFGGGKIDEPIYIILAGRAITQLVRGGNTSEVPLGKLVTTSVKSFFQKNFRFLDVDRDVIADYRIKSGSVDLVGIFDGMKDVPLSNDTSFGVSYAPLTPTEKLVLETEKYMNSEKFKKELPEVGEDIKVMALRRGDEVKLTVSAAMISSLIPDRDHYLNVKEETCRRLKDFASKITDRIVEVNVNVGDDPQRDIFYLTITGTSAERGDDGNTGRGNRINGLITPCRQMSLEAAAGKNPVSHVGKLYNVLAKIVAQKIYEEVKGISEVYVKVLSQIGKPIDEPLITNVQAVLQDSTLDHVSSDINGIVNEEFENITKLTDVILRGEVELF